VGNVWNGLTHRFETLL